MAISLAINVVLKVFRSRCVVKFVTYWSVGWVERDARNEC